MTDLDDPFANLRTPGSKRSKFAVVEGGEIVRKKIARSNLGSIQSKKAADALLRHVQAGMTITEALNRPDVARSRKWYEWKRKQDRHFAAECDIARAGMSALEVEWDGSHADFALRYFQYQYAPFQLMIVEELERTPPGNILMVLMPPEHGKTSIYENYASETLARNPNARLTIASESVTIARKILGRVKHRMEPEGPYPRYVQDFGPFKPAYGQGRDRMQAQPWGADYFNVYKKSRSDERDYSMIALGYGSSIVSTRTDHLHCDDLQSLKTLTATDRIEDWFRQDALSRPGEYGKTTVVGTRVGDDDVYERLANDDNLDGILRVIKLPAITIDPLTHEERALWPDRYNLDQLARQRRKVGEEAWDRNYMQNPGASDTARTFPDEAIEQCKNPLISLHHHMPTGRVCYVSLDPALGGQNCVTGWEISPDNKMVLRSIREVSGLRQNEQIMQEVNAVILDLQAKGGRVSDLVIEAMNFQKGLANDERLKDMQKHYGFAMRPHLTGLNKYDADIGVASMVGSFLRGEIVLPWADDPLTRVEIEELVRQLKAWKPGKRGNKLRQDRVMSMWFAWVLWRSRYKSAAVAEMNVGGFRRQGVPWGGTKTSLILPVGVKL